jgi:FkbM family methyltransferase
MKKIILFLRKMLVPAERIRNLWRRRSISQLPEYQKLTLRKNSSDESVFWQVFVEREYDFPLAIEPKLIIDGGANVGCTTLWFAEKFPQAKIIAVEPEESNFKVLQENIKQLPNVKAIRAGIWDKSCDLQVKDIGLGNWAFEIEQAGENEKNKFSAVTINQILAESGFQEIDILKLDIEGAEKEIFEASCEAWLSRTKVLIIELHEYFREGINKAFNEAIAKYDFEQFKKGEKVILIRRNKDEK